jgi:hypothetical protein
LLVNFGFDARVNPKNRLDAPMCDFAVLNDLQIRVIDVFKLFLFDDYFTTCFIVADYDRFGRFADRVV